MQRLAEQNGWQRERTSGGASGGSGAGTFGGMIDHLIERTGALDSLDPGTMEFAAAGGKKHTISKDDFAEIPDTREPRRIAFVDGGNALLAEAPAFLIGINRVYYSLFRGGERQRPNLPPRMEFFSCLTAVAAAGRTDAPAAPRRPPARPAAARAAAGRTAGAPPAAARDLYTVDLFMHGAADRRRPPPDVDHGITVEDVKRQGASRAELLSVPRKIAEWDVADFVVAKELDADDVLVMDGTLQSGSARESAFAANVYENAREKGVTMCGLAKTTTLTTTDNRPLVVCACRLAEAAGLGDKRWFVRIGECATANDKGYTIIAKLHEKSRYAFRLGVLAEQYKDMSEGEVESVLASMAANSRDIAMPGYPYGAIDADRFAKVRMREASMYRNMLDAELMRRPGGADIVAQIKSMSAHQVLNRVTG